MSEEIKQLNIDILNDRLKSLLKQKSIVNQTINIEEERKRVYGLDAPAPLIISIEEKYKELEELDKKIKKIEDNLANISVEKDEHSITIYSEIKEPANISMKEPISSTQIITSSMQEELKIVEPSIEKSTIQADHFEISPIISTKHISDLENQIIEIGFTSSITDTLEHTKSLVKIIESDLNRYLETLGRNFSVKFVIKDNKGQTSVALENIISFKERGINLITGDWWSSHAQASLDYINNNNMILITASSTSPILSHNDSLFRMSPNDFSQAPALAEMWKSWGCEAVLTIHRADQWAHGIMKLLEKEFARKGIKNIGEVKYPADALEFSSILHMANDIVSDAITQYTVDKVGIQVIGFSEVRNLQVEASNFPNLINIIWMSTESGGRSQSMLNEAGEWAIKTRHFSPVMGVDEGSIEYEIFESRYYDETQQMPSFYIAADYDACWLLVQCILETGSIDVNDILKSILPISRNCKGITGLLGLDHNGDRYPQFFDIWGFYEDPDTGEHLFRKWGQYNGRLEKATWDDEILAQYAKIIRPRLKRYTHPLTDK